MTTRISAVCAGVIVVASALVSLNPARGASGGSCSLSSGAVYVLNLGSSIAWHGNERCDFVLQSLTISSALYNGGGGVVAGQPLEAAGSTGICQNDNCTTASTHGALPLVVPASEHVLITKFVAVDHSGWTITPGTSACHVSGVGGLSLTCLIPYAFTASPLGGPTPGGSSLSGIADSAQLVVRTAGLN
jgi:hypothetical protein